jgi:hypothetical protein
VESLPPHGVVALSWGRGDPLYLPWSSRATVGRMNTPPKRGIMTGVQTNVCGATKGVRSVEVAQPGRGIGRDIGRGEATERELDAFISKRHEQRVKSEGERQAEEAWRESERRALPSLGM